jgi:alkylation response protein AidB-like acyl-CoA dehydrogenase
MSTVDEQVQKARALAPMIKADGDEINRIRKLTPRIVSALKEGSFFRMLQPKFLGGMELRPSHFARVTEVLARMDASVGWVTCQSNGCSMTSAYMDRKVAHEIFGSVDGIVAWGPQWGGAASAKRVDGGYRINGTWRFASGSQNASWMGAHVYIDGTKELRTFLFPQSSVKMEDIWHTVGLRGTASNQYVATDLFVPEERALYRDDPKHRREDGLLYRFTSGQLYSAGFAGVGLGIARGIMDDFLNLPATKIARGASRPMRENNVVQSQYAQCEARWRSARCFLHDTLEEVWKYIEEHGEMTLEQRALIRLASTWAIQNARDVVNTLYHAAGSVVVFEENPFERRLRDMHTVAQQSQGRQLHYETVGQLMLGMPAENVF